MAASRRWLAVGGTALLALAPSIARAEVPTSAQTCPANRLIADRAAGQAPVLCVTADHVHREGTFLIVDAVVTNISTRPVSAAEVSVEFYTYSDDLLGAEETILRPARLEPGQTGTVLVATPWQEGVEKIRYRITWQEAGRQHQGEAEHGVALG